MKASTELFLWEMLSIAEALYYPSYRYADESFEGWAHRNGLLRQIQRLEAQAYLERQPGGSADRVYRLTPMGRLAALGGKDPEQCWQRSWDGHWRLLMFDLPQSPKAPRFRLRKVLKEHGLGCLQGSVWLSPDPLEPLRKQLKGDRHPSSLLLFEGHATGGEKASELVREAWDFGAINNDWAAYRNIIRRGKEFLKGGKIDRKGFREWSQNRHRLWKLIIERDPFLPSPLLPRKYPGRKIWKEHKNLCRQIPVHLKKFGFKKS